MKIILYVLIVYFQLAESKIPSSNDFKCNCNISNEPISHPYQIALGFVKPNNIPKIIGVCQGIIINFYYVLTSANCLNRYAMGNFLYSSERFAKNDTEIFSSQRIYNPKYIFHPSYTSDSSDINYYKYNFALIYFPNHYIDLDFNIYKPACFSFDKKLYRSLKKKVVGFGSRKVIKLNERNLILEGQKELNDFQTVIFFDKISVTKKFRSQVENFKNLCLDRNLFCLESNYQVCVGDEGSPLYMLGDDFAYVTGMAIKPPSNLMADNTYGICIEGETSYFARLEYSIEFVESIVGKDKMCLVKSEENEFDFETEIINYSDKNCNCFTNHVYDFITESPDFDKRFSGIPISNKTFEFHFSAFVYSLEDKTKNCLGTVIGVRELLLPADCVDGTQADKLKVYSELIYKKVNNYNKKLPVNYVKGLEYFIHPNYRKNPFVNNIAILRTQFELKGGTIDSIFHPFKQACLSNQNDFYSIKDDIFVLPNVGYDHSVIFLRDKLKYRIHNDYDCQTQICFKYLKINLEENGHPLFRITKGHLDIFGFFLKRKSEGDYLKFVNINREINWIRSIVGYHKVCERKQANRIVNDNQCSCYNNLDDLKKQTDYIINIVTYKINFNPKRICKGILLNDFYILTMASCFKVFEEEILEFYAYSATFKYLSLAKLKSYKTLNLAAKIEIIMIHPNYTEKNVENDLAVAKLESGLLIGKKPINFSCIFSSTANYIYEPNDVFVFQKNNDLVKLERKKYSSNTSLESYCDDDNFICFNYNNRYCKIDHGNPVILLQNEKSIVFSLVTIKANIDPLERCETLIFIKALKINNKIDWIRSIIGSKSYCTLKKNKIENCDCYSDLNYVTIAQRYHNSKKFKLLCRATIINKYWVITSAQCLLRRQGTIINDNKYVSDVFEVDSIEKQTNDIEKIIYHDLINDDNIAIEFVKKTNYKVILIKLKTGLKFGFTTSLYPACLSNTKFPLQYAFLSQTPAQSSTLYLEPLEIGSKKIDSKDKICLLKEVVCYQNNVKLCKQDQGKTIITSGHKSGYRTIGFLFNPTNRLRNTSISSNNEKKCFKSYFFTGFFVDINAKWLNDEVLADGMCHYKEQYDDDLCNCYFKLPYIGRIFNGSEEVRNSIRFMTYIFVNVNRESKSFKTQDYRLIASGALINEAWVLTSNIAGIEKFVPDDIYVGFGDRLNLDKYHYFETLRKVSYYKNYIYEGGMLLLRLQEPITIGPESNIYPACLLKTGTKSNLKTLTKAYGFGIAKGNPDPKKVKFEDLPVLTNFVYNELQTIEVKNHIDKFNCGSDELCFTSLGRTSLVDTGGPIVNFANDKLFLVAIIIPVIENFTVREITASDNLKGKKIFYYWPWIQQQTFSSEYCFHENTLNFQKLKSIL